MVFWSPSCYKQQKLTTKPFTGRALRVLRVLLIQMQNISVQSSGMYRKQNLGLKVTQQTWVLLFPFSCHFFSFAGHLVGLILVGKVFRKAFRILGLDERKGRWVVEKDFLANFLINLTWFFAFFSGVLDWIVLILVWFERYLNTHVSGQSCPWPLKVTMSQAVEGTWIRRGCYGQLRGEWVKRYGKTS